MSKQEHHNRKKFNCRAGYCAGLALMIAGGICCCGCGGSQLDVLAERARNAAGDRAQYDADKPRVLKELTLEQAQELALKYNLQLWMARQEEAVRRETKYATFLKMLPNLSFDYNLEARDSYNASTSIGMNTGRSAQLTTYSYGSDTEHAYGGMKMLFNVLDFGITYFRAKQEMNREKQGAYERQRTRQKLLADVADAYYTCQNYDRVAKRVEELHGKFTAELARLQSSRDQGLIGDTEALERGYLLKTQKSRRAEFLERRQAAHTRFLQLMGLPVDAQFTLADSQENTLPEYDYDLAKLEESALLQRPELFREDLSERISRDEVRANMLSLLPSPSLFINPQGDTNSHLYYNTWFNAGLNLSYNLLSVPSKIATTRASKRVVEFSKARRMALATAILTQVRLAVIEHDFALQRYQLLLDLYNDSEKIAQNFLKAAKAGKAKDNAVISQQARGLEDFAKLQDAYARVLVARARIAETIGGKVADFLPAKDEAPVQLANAEEETREEEEEFCCELVNPAEEDAGDLAVLGEENANAEASLAQAEIPDMTEAEDANAEMSVQEEELATAKASAGNIEENIITLPAPREITETAPAKDAVPSKEIDNSTPNYDREAQPWWKLTAEKI